MKKRLIRLFALILLFGILSLTITSAHYQQARINYPKQYKTYNYYSNKYYAPKFTDYKLRNYGHEPQLVRFRLNNYPLYKPSYKYLDCYKTRYHTVCYN